MREIPNNSDKPEIPKNPGERHLIQQKLELAEAAKPADKTAPEQTKIYTAAAEKGAAEHPNNHIKAQGRAGEQVALQDVREQQGQAVDLNEEVGENFPIYDAGGPDGVTSVKVRGLESGPQLRDSTRNAYLADLEEAVGRGGGTIEPTILGHTDQNYGLAKFNNAARHLNEYAQENPGRLSSEIAQSPDSAADYLRDHGTLTIPRDHAGQVRADLQQRLFSDNQITKEVQAARLGLDVNSPDYRAKAQRMIERVKEMPITSAELKNVLDNKRAG